MGLGGSMSKNKESLSLLDGGALIVEQVVPRRGTFTLMMPDTMCFEVTESGRTLRVDPPVSAKLSPRPLRPVTKIEGARTRTEA